MTQYDDLETWIWSENEDDDSVDDQVVVVKWFRDRKITVIDDQVARTSQVKEHVGHRLDHQVRTCLDNLVEIDVLVQIAPPGTGRYIRHHRTGKNFYDPGAREFVPLLKEDLSRLLEDLTSLSERTPQIADGGAEEEENDVPPETLRGIAADTLNVERDSVERALTGPADPIEQMNRYDAVVKAIKESDTVSRIRNYDEMGWRNMALRWSLSERAAHIATNHSLGE